MSVNKCVLILPLFFAIGKYFVMNSGLFSSWASLVENEAPSTSSIQKTADGQSLPTVLYTGLRNILWLYLCENWFIMGSCILACLVQLTWVPIILERF